jgi:hypothetical protein
MSERMPEDKKQKQVISLIFETSDIENQQKQCSLLFLSEIFGAQKESAYELNHFCGHAGSIDLHPHIHKRHQTPVWHL